MRFDRESWRKLYRDESVEHRLLPVLARGLRDYLIRHAKDDGTILTKTDDPGGDLARALGAHADEFDLVARYVGDWIRDGYLTHTKGKLAIKNFKVAQQSRTPEAERQRRFREKKRAVEGVTGNVTPGVTCNVTDVTPVTPTRAPARLVSSPLVSSETPEGVQGGDGETVCPPDLVARLTAVGVPDELAAALGVPVSAVLATLDDFAGYWTIGAGTGKRRRQWPARAREWVRDQHRQGKLAKRPADALSPSEHARLQAEAEKRNAADAARRRAKLEAEYPEVTGDDLDAARRALVAAP